MNRDRGATLVEYALGVALLAVAIIASVDHFTEAAEDRYDDRSAQGDPAEEFGRLGPDGAIGGGTEDPDPPDAQVEVMSVAPLTAEATPSGSDKNVEYWTMSVTVRVTGDGGPLEGAVVRGSSWTPSGNGTLGPCTTNQDGLCSFTQSQMIKKTNSPPTVDTATFTLLSVTYQNPDATVLSEMPSSPEVTCSKPPQGEKDSVSC